MPPALNVNLAPNIAEVRKALSDLSAQIADARKKGIDLKVKTETPQALKDLLSHQRAAADQQRRYAASPLVQRAQREEGMAAAKGDRTLALNVKNIQAKIDVDKLSADTQRRLNLHPLNIQAKIDADKLARDTQRQIEAHPLNIKARIAEDNRAAQHRKSMDEALDKERRAQWNPKTIFGSLAKVLGAKAPSAEAQAAGGLKGAGAEVGALGTIPGVGPALAGISAVSKALSVLGSTAESTVGKFAPGALLRFNYVMDDVQATIGEALLPVLNLMTDGMRLVGDTLASILPSTDDMTAALSPISEIVDTLREALGEVAPDLKDLGKTLLQGLAVGLQLAADGVKLLVKFLEALFSSAGDAAGQAEKTGKTFAAAVSAWDVAKLVKEGKTPEEARKILADRGKVEVGKDGKPLASSVGKAARAISFSSQEEAAKQVYKAAQFGGTTKKVGIEDLLGEGSPMLKVLNSIDAWVKDIASKMGIVRGAATAAGNPSAAMTVGIEWIKMKLLGG